jgi:hypothetical protein
MPNLTRVPNQAFAVVRFPDSHSHDAVYAASAAYLLRRLLGLRVTTILGLRRLLISKNVNQLLNVQRGVDPRTTVGCSMVGTWPMRATSSDSTAVELIGFLFTK